VSLEQAFGKSGGSVPADSFVVNQSLVLRINICGGNRHLRQAPKRCVPCEKKPTHIQAHLVFADTQANAEKPKELEFLPTLTGNRRN
jgi:hypothetical protein